MFAFTFRHFGKQMRALIAKNLLVSVWRSPIGFLLCVYGVPLAILALLLSIPSFLISSNVEGMGSPGPVRDFAGTVHKTLVIIKPPHLGPDVDRVIDTFTKPLDKSKLHYLESESQLPSVCLANLRGVSNCHGAVTFVDSPETKGTVEDSLSLNNGHVWQYVIRADPAKSDSHFDVNAHNSDSETFFLPMQLAIDSAITNTTVKPEVFMYTEKTEEEKKQSDRELYVTLIGQIYVFALFAAYFTIIFRMVGFITAERESGMSQLIDGMGGEGSIVARVLSWILIFDLTCLPCFIVFGVLYKQIIFPTQDIGLMIGWQIMLGLAVNHSTVFAAAWFTKSRVSAVYVIGAFLLLSVGTQVYSFQRIPLPGPPGAYVLTALFPSANHVLFTQQMALWELQGLKANIASLPKPAIGINSTSYEVSQATMLGFLALHIVLYPLLAILAEKFMHGIDFSKRKFQDADTESTTTVVETFDLKKRFVPSFLEKVFCCGKRKSVTAVDGVSLQGHKGQILCLVGPNGSGKTTTLHIMSGFYKPSAGSVQINAKPSQIGICPQRNTLWDELSVKQHVTLWSKIKGGRESPQELEELIASCDLQSKHDSPAKTLSGGQKRKLQLACMFVGNSTVCLIDECTSGLDPLSRRVIWEILLEQRSKRSIVFTTHFLDEVDVLADHIVILSKGKVRCQGAATELKHLYGGGYKVFVPRSVPELDVAHPRSIHQDSMVYTTPDSSSAAQLVSKFSATGVTDVTLSGPQVEDVFLRVADEPDLEFSPTSSHSNSADFKMTPAEFIPFRSQVGVLFRKRFTILRRFWWPYLYVVAIPVVISPFFNKITGNNFTLAKCENLQPHLESPYVESFYVPQGCGDSTYPCSGIGLAPASANITLYETVKKNFTEVSGINITDYYKFVSLQDDRKGFMDFIANSSSGYTVHGGLYMGSRSEAPIIGYKISDYGQSYAFQMANLWSQMNSGIEIVASRAGFAQESDNRSADNSSLPGIVFAVFFTLVQTIYPAAFVLYPAIEKARQVRALQYANGVRRGPLWVAYGLFDFLFVIVIAIAVTAISSTYLPWNGTIWVMIPILAFYGLAAILLGYIISHFVKGPLKSFFTMLGISTLMFIISAISFGVGSAFATAASMDKTTLGIAYGLNIILPIGNVFRAIVIGLNIQGVGCKNGQPIASSSIEGFGGPILYLIIQIAVLLLIIVWIEGDLALFRRKAATSHFTQDTEKKPTRGPSDEVEQETHRVLETPTDLLRALHLSKSFGNNKAVDDISLGLPPSNVTALIGPNGAGKSTFVNLIQSELAADHGRIFLNGEDSRTRSAQKFLGVCPQYDALDLMNTQEHLAFYARVKGIKDVKGNVNHIMNELNLTPHASTLATKLSGGNKRKLNLAIALMGTPPVLVLDEPTSAMDAVAKRYFWKIIQKTTPGRSVLLTTHSMEEADTLAHRTAIISQRLLAVGSTRALREKYSNVYYVSILLKSAPTSSVEEMERVQSWVQERIPNAMLERDMLGGQVRFTIPGIDAQGGRPVAGVIELLEKRKEAMNIEYYSVGGATLENVFLSVVRENNVLEEDGVPHKRNIVQRLLRR